MSEKTEKATPYKLQKAKEKGQVSKSVELTTCISLLVICLLINALWEKQSGEIQTLIRQLLHSAANIRLTIDTISHLHQYILSLLINLWLPFALAGVLAIILGTMAQTGVVWSATPLIPDFKRLNFIQNFKRLFSLKICFDAFKSTFKLIFAFLLIGAAIRYQLPAILHLMHLQPSQYPELMMNFILKLFFQLLVFLSLTAVLDKFYTRWKFNKDNRMSKQEVKDEYKQKEGDPKVKSKIKQLQHQLRQKTSSLAAVKSADVVITNPTHIAIALKYDRAVMPAPKVVCKVQGDMVKEVKKLAQRYGVPIREHKAFARMLYQSIELNQGISKDLYPVAAGIFREIYEKRNNR